MERDAIDAKGQAEIYIDLLSHDISNMNAAIEGYIKLAIERMDIEVKNKELFTEPLSLLSNSERLIDIVQKIRQVECHNSGYGLIDLGWLLEDIRSEHEHWPNKEVKIHYKTTIKRYVIASDLLRDIFSNIIGNAIKHSLGAVEINILLSKVVENGTEFYRVYIEDDGPGIPDEMKSKIFERKQRGHTKTNGAGLGLFLVKKLVDDLHGKVWIEDKVPGR